MSIVLFDFDGTLTMREMLPVLLELADGVLIRRYDENGTSFFEYAMQIP